MNNALIVVDVQRDFCEDGKLAVVGGNATAKAIAGYIEDYGSTYDEIVFTMDYHEPWPRTNGGHFSATPDFVNSWPPHCEAGTEGAWLHPEIYVVTGMLTALSNGVVPQIFKKGLGQPDYSGFQGHNRVRVSLNEYLRSRNINHVDVCGIAGDYCVRQTALDAKRMGFSTDILAGLVVSVGGPEATKAAVDELANL